MSDSLATAETLIATQTPGLVTIKATGHKPTPAHDVCFQQTPIEIFPPQYRLLLIDPTQPSAEVVARFRAETSFPAADPIQIVIVFDAAGRHDVSVDHAFD